MDQALKPQFRNFKKVGAVCLKDFSPMTGPSLSTTQTLVGTSSPVNASKK